MEEYIYDHKMMGKFPLGKQFKQNLYTGNQWKIENSGNEIARW